MTEISILGVTHIDSESPEKVAKFLEKFKPNAICLELDEYRLNILLENEKILQNGSQIYDQSEIEQISSIVNFDTEDLDFASLLTDIGFFENQLARIIQTDQPGTEMLVAYKLAKEIGAETILIDRSLNDISKFLDEEVSKEESEKFQNLVDELMFDKKMVSKPVEKKDSDKKITDIEQELETMENNEEININEVLDIFKEEESINKILSIFNESFPKLYSILLEDRNDYMIKRICEIAPNYEKIAVILGYGHVSPVARGLANCNVNFKIIIEKE